MRKLSIVFMLFLVLTDARAGNGASVYSIFGIGDVRYYPNARSAGMGYTGIGLAAGNYINSMVPAAWSRINRTRIEGNFLYEGFGSKDASSSLYRANGVFNGVMLAIPISQPHGIVFGAGFMPYSNVDYLTSRQKTDQGFTYTLNDEGTGGLERGVLGLSYAPLPDLSLGASFNYMFGTITDTRTLIPAATNFSGGQSKEDVSFRGVTVSLSGIYSGFGSIHEALSPLSLGFVISSRGNLSAERQVFSTFTFVSEADTSAIATGRLTIPVSIGMGAAYQIGDRYIVAGDFFSQPWRRAELFGNELNGVRSSSRFGIGAERLPSRDPGASWFERVTYRIGFTTHATYYRVNGEPINEWGITAGLGIPLFLENRLNIGLEYGSRGTTANSLVKDRIWRISASLNLSEMWFVRYEEE